LITLLFSHVTARATVYRMLTGDFTTINPDWSAYENGFSFDTVESGTPFQPLVSTQHFKGNASLQIQVPTDTSGNKERFEYVIAHATAQDGLHFDNARYCGFAFKLGSPAAAFTSSDLFWQAWQGSPWGPPASLKLTSDSSPPYTIGLYIRNMATGPDSAVPDTKLWSSAMVQPDVWYSVVIYISPRYTGNNGNIKLWINGTNFVNTTTNIGYDPAQVTNTYNGLDIKNGMYQPDANNGHTMYFDQIMVADSYAEAAATPPTANTPPNASAGVMTMLRNSSADFDLTAVAHDAETPAAQCRYSVGSSNGAVVLLADGHTARFVPATNFTGVTGFNYAVTDTAEDPRELLHYNFNAAGDNANGFTTDNSGHFRDGNLQSLGTGAFALSTNAPPALQGATSLQLMKSGTTNAARLYRYASNTAEFNFSDASWTFSGWFQRTATTNHDFIFYLGSGDGFGGDGDELQFYCPGGATTLALQHYNTNNVLDINAASAAGVTAGDWHHAVLVFQRTNSNAGVLSAFLDGAQFASTNINLFLKQSTPMVFGGHNKTNSNLNRWFGGCIADIAFFTNALSAAEIATLASGPAGRLAGLSASNTVTVTVTNFSHPRITNFAPSNGLLTMQVSGDAGAHYAIESSSNLFNWVSLWTTNPASMPFTFAAPVSAAMSSAFYRIVIGP
jgi:hypothetical protein